MDILPNTCSKIVNNGAVKLLVDKMMNFEYIDLAECSVKALEKIALENPYAILSSSALPIFFNLIDFFDSSVQVCFFLFKSLILLFK
jgi:E3 ubiquitin-protein ligase TRIP12